MTSPQDYVVVPMPPHAKIQEPGAVDKAGQSDVYYQQDRDRDLWQAIRQSLLLQVDAIERRLGICPRTSEIRRLSR